MQIKTEMDISQGIKDIIQILTKETDLILIGVERGKAREQAKRWFDIKRRRQYVNKSGS